MDLWVCGHFSFGVPELATGADILTAQRSSGADGALPRLCEKHYYAHADLNAVGRKSVNTTTNEAANFRYSGREKWQPVGESQFS